MIIDSEELVKIGMEVVEAITGERFPGPVEIIPGYNSWAYSKALGRSGKTEISQSAVEAGLQRVVWVEAHELKHQLSDKKSGREPEANRFADEIFSRIEQTAFSDLEPAASLRVEAARRFGGLKPLSQEQIVERYEKTLTTLGEERIDLGVTKEAASILTEEDLRKGVTRVTINENVLQPHHIRMVEKQEELHRIYRKSLMNHRRNRP